MNRDDVGLLLGALWEFSLKIDLNPAHDADARERLTQLDGQEAQA